MDVEWRKVDLPLRTGMFIRFRKPTWQKHLARYKKKLRFYTTLYTNKIKKANRSIASLERYIREDELKVVASASADKEGDVV